MPISFVAENSESEDVARGCVRAGLEYFVETVGHLITISGGQLVDAVILVTIMAGNVASLDKGRNGGFAAVGAIPPDSDRKPVSVYALSKQLQLPYETARRHVMNLEKRGLCQRVGRGGVIVPQATVQKMGRGQMFPAFVADIEGFVSKLDALGAIVVQAPPAAELVQAQGWIR